MSNRKPDELLAFLTPRLRQILSTLAKRDRRDELQELIWLIEAYAKGQLKNLGDESIAPKVDPSSFDRPGFVTETSIRRVPRQSAAADEPDLHE